jgi:hypothetical protein
MTYTAEVLEVYATGGPISSDLSRSFRSLIGQVMDNVLPVRWIRRLGNQIQVLHVFANGDAQFVAEHHAGERLALSLPIQCERLESGVVREKKPAETRGPSEKILIR